MSAASNKKGKKGRGPSSTRPKAATADAAADEVETSNEPGDTPRDEETPPDS